MHIIRRHPRWWMAFFLCTALGLFVYRFEWLIKASGIPLEWTFGTHSISLKRLVVSIVMMLASILMSLWISLHLEKHVLQLTTLDNNLRVVLTKLIRAMLVITSAFLCGSILGIDLTVFSVLGGALGVGLGLALQRIASSYIAGYIILIERSLEIGNMVRVDKYYGRLTRLTNRYAVLDALDGTEMLIPNELFITQPVINYAYSERATSVALTIMMAHNIDVDHALELLSAIGLAHPRTLKSEHTPSAWIKQMNEVGIELELSVWITDPEEGIKGLKTELFQAIWKAFQAEGWKLANISPSVFVSNSNSPDLKK
jgi:small-conductance mechanosensitive channel